MDVNGRYPLLEVNVATAWWDTMGRARGTLAHRGASGVLSHCRALPYSIPPQPRTRGPSPGHVAGRVDDADPFRTVRGIRNGIEELPTQRRPVLPLCHGNDVILEEVNLKRAILKGNTFKRLEGDR